LAFVSTSCALIETERLILRPWRPDDLPAFVEMNADPRVMEFFQSTLDEEQSRAFAERVAQHFADKGFGLWAVEVRGGAPFVGFVGLSVPRFDTHFTPCVEIGWRLAHAAWGKGYATEAARAALLHGFDVLKLDQIVSFTTAANLRSRSVMEKIGMRRDPADDFDHPSIPEAHPQRPHVLYRKARAG
jgi:RimJ/RimL family protein N-acetyltransferase